MRPRKTENRDLPPGMVRRKRPRKNGTVWVGYYYRDANGKELSLGGDLDKARLKWAELESKAKLADLKIMKGIFDRYERDIIPKKAPRTQKDNKAELKHLRKGFEAAPIDAITPSMIAQYRDARTAKTRANREIALLSHVYNMAREWGFTDRENPCAGVRKNKEKVRDYYANEMVWTAVYGKAPQELRDAMDLAYLTGQRPADVIAMRRGDIEGDYLTVQQGKTGKRLRIQMQAGGVKNTSACSLRTSWPGTVSTTRSTSSSAERGCACLNKCCVTGGMTPEKLLAPWPPARDELMTRRRSNSFSSRISAPKPLPKSRISPTQASCSVTRNRRSPSACTGASVRSRSLQNELVSERHRLKFRNSSTFPQAIKNPVDVNLRGF